MGKYFGTDGVRGVANEELTLELAYKIGRCGGYVLTSEKKRPKIIIGRDTRISGPMLEAALAAGLASIGADVIRLGVITTPGVAYLTRELQADAGVMISASHNPVEDNGIKFFGADGFKLSDETELEIERLMDAATDELPRPVGAQVGTITDDERAKWSYVEFLKTTVSSTFSSVKLVLDCAHGAAYELAPRIFRELGAEVISTGAEPDGVNINEGCGSTHPEALSKQVLLHKADLGLAFDGDADRLIAVDQDGKEVDGDYILTILAESLKHKGRLQQNTVVSTVMGNLGFFKAVNAMGIESVKAAVGDRYVMEEMRKGGYNLGGEQSGHIIMLDYNTTGDGMLSGIQLLDVLIQSGQSLAQARSKMEKFPQVLVNVKVKDKSKLDGNEAILKAVQEVEASLGDDGRVLVRPSGTEPLVRVMVEGPEKDVTEQYAQQIVKVVQQELV